MAYLPQFKNDLFISYRRASNEGQDAWVDSFCNSVRTSLKDLVGDVAIWRDTGELKAGDLWRPEIADAVDNSGIFVALISRTYFDSDECRKELDRFLGRMKRRDDARADGIKLVPVYKHPTKPEQELPPELSQIGHHEFFNLQPKPWRELDPKRDPDDYHERLGRVVFDLMEALEQLHGAQKKQTLGKVFVACVGPELLQDRQRLRADLRQRGWLVVPEHEYLWNADNHAQVLADDLAGAQLCVHLVSPQASIEPLTHGRSRDQLEKAHAAMQAQGLPPPLVWIQPSDTVDASARPLIDYIETDLANHGVDYLQGSLEDFKTLVVDKLPRPVPAPPAPAAEVPQVALLVDEADLADAAALRALMSGPLGVEPRPLKFNGSQPKDAERLARTLAACGQALIVWGAQDEDWVFDLLDQPALARHLGPERLCVVTIGAASAEKRAFASKKARLVQATGTDATSWDAAATALHGFIAAAPPPP